MIQWSPSSFEKNKKWCIAHGVEYAEAFQIIRIIERNEQ